MALPGSLLVAALVAAVSAPATTNDGYWWPDPADPSGPFIQGTA